MQDILLLGLGYTGQALKTLLDQKQQPYFATYRSRDPGMACAAPTAYFNLLDQSTWSVLPETRFTICTFTLEPWDIVEKWWQECGSRLGQLIVIGSTSCYIHKPNDIVDESFELDLKQPRVLSETNLRTRGAIVLASAGIYGPQRNPLNWLRRGLIRDHEAFVNLIHVEDLARALLSATEHAKAGEIYNVSDGQARRWQDIIDWAKSNQHLGYVTPSSQKNSGSKIIDNTKLLSAFDFRLEHPDLLQELDLLERVTRP